MKDVSTNLSAEEMLKNTVNKNKLIKYCKEYFEISIGERKPTGPEKSEAIKLLLKESSFPIYFPKILKYPIADSQSIKLYCTSIEYEIYKLLAKETDLVDFPHIPMLRYELIFQKQLFEEDELEMALIRQFTLIETYLRDKADLGHVKWEYTVKCAHRGEKLFQNISKYDGYEKDILDDLEQFKGMRNKYAHGWKTYIKARKNINLRENCRIGLRIIIDFLLYEIEKTFKQNSNKHISERYPTDWENRESCELTANKVTVNAQIICENCNEEFYPSNYYFRCPNCNKQHGYWEN